MRISKIIRYILAVAAITILIPVTAYAEGWVNQDGNWFYYYSDGTRAMSRITPDGFYVDQTGLYTRERMNLLGEQFTSPARFLSPDSMGEWETVLPALNRINKTIRTKEKSTRVFHVFASSITYSVSDKSNKETLIMSFNKNPAVGGYDLKMYGMLNDQYDVAVFKYFFTIFSNRPIELSDAIYGSWQGSNPYGIIPNGTVSAGDAQIKCTAVTGCATYTISPLR